MDAGLLGLRGGQLGPEPGYRVAATCRSSHTHTSARAHTHTLMPTYVRAYTHVWLRMHAPTLMGGREGNRTTNHLTTRSLSVEQITDEVTPAWDRRSRASLTAPACHIRLHQGHWGQLTLANHLLWNAHWRLSPVRQADGYGTNVQQLGCKDA